MQKIGEDDTKKVGGGAAGGWVSSGGGKQLQIVGMEKQHSRDENDAATKKSDVIDCCEPGAAAAREELQSAH